MAPSILERPSSRRRFVSIWAAAWAGLMITPSLLRPRTPVHRCHPRRPLGPHPTPRPGVTSEKLPSADYLARYPQAADVFEQVRQIPEVIDGIRCNCGCADQDGFYSLLTCYEGEEAMARFCDICQGQGRLAYRLHQAGKSLEEIRAGVDARYG